MIAKNYSSYSSHRHRWMDIIWLLLSDNYIGLEQKLDGWRLPVELDLCGDHAGVRVDLKLLQHFRLLQIKIIL